MSNSILAGFRQTSQRPQNQAPTQAPVEALSEEKRKEIEQRIREAFEQDTKSKQEIENEETAWSSEDSLAAAQKFFSSAALGWGDEIGLWVSAAINANVTYPMYDLETTTREQYKKLKSDYDEKQRQFEQRQQTAATVSEIAGGFASPAMALRAATTLGRGGLAVGESALFGAGAAEEGQRTQGATTGALGGALGFGAVTAATKGLGKGVDVLSRRRVEGDLIDDDGDFVPLTLAASSPKGSEGTLHTIYRDVVAPSFGGKGVIKEQEERIITKIDKVIEDQRNFSKALDDGIKLKEQESKNAMSDAFEALKQERTTAQRIKKEKAGKTILPLETKLAAYRTGKPEEIAAKATKQIQTAIDARHFDFRNQAFINAMPEGSTSKDVEKVLRLDTMGEKIRELDSLWKKKGYSMIKNRKFRFKSGELQKTLEKALLNDPYFIVNTVDIPSVMKVFDKAVEDTDFFKDKSGRISGELVGSLRSHIGTLANNADEPQKRRALYTLQDEIDKIMKSQLTDVAKQSFEKEASKWKTTVVLREAIENSQVKKRGAFEPEDWIREVGRNNRWDSRYGTGPLNKTARDLQDNLNFMSKSIARRASTLAKTKANLIGKELSEHKKQLEAALKKIDADTADKKRRIRNNPQFAEEIATMKVRKDQLSRELSILDKNLKQLNQLRASPNPTWYYTMAASSILGGLALGGPVGGLVGPGVAYGIGKGLSSPTVQRALAGQTQTQRSIQELLKSDRTGRTAEILQRTGGVVGSRTATQQGMLTGENQ